MQTCPWDTDWTEGELQFMVGNEKVLAQQSKHSKKKLKDLNELKQQVKSSGSKFLPNKVLTKNS